MTWPGTAGIAVYNGASAWYTSLEAISGLYGITFTSSAPMLTALGTAATATLGIAANDVVQLNGSAQLPAVSAALLTNLPTLASLGGASTYGTVTDGAPITWNIASQTVKNGVVTLNHATSTRALNLTNLVAGGFYTLEIFQDSTGGAALTLGSGCTWKVSNGGAGTITLTGTPSSLDTLTFSYDGTRCITNLEPNFN
jgi:hypothetical protein